MCKRCSLRNFTKFTAKHLTWAAADFITILPFKSTFGFLVFSGSKNRNIDHKWDKLGNKHG